MSSKNKKYIKDKTRMVNQLVINVNRHHMVIPTEDLAPAHEWRKAVVAVEIMS